MNILSVVFGSIMDLSYNIVKNYGLAIIIFTILTKIILLPVSIWQQRNSIKMVKMQPEINQIKIDHFGDKETIEELQQETYKKNKYNAFASVVPSILQIIILLGVMAVIRENIKSGNYNTNFLGVDLGAIPIEEKGKLLLFPIISGLSSLLLSIFQSKANVLQSSQSISSQIITAAISIGISLYLGFYVPAGVVLYWIVSNILAIVLQLILNKIINPNDYVDHKRLEESKTELDRLNSLDSKTKRSIEEIRKEKEDYKKFFNILNKHLVFYSESNGFYKYFKGTIEYILNNSNITIHYITSDYNDKIFELEKTNNKIKAYYIGEKKLITLMMKMDADIVVMTMPDLDNFHIKRSYVRKDIEYIFVPHGVMSNNMTMRKASMDNFDTILSIGKHQSEEIEKTEIAYGLKKKKIVEAGMPLLDDMIANYNEFIKNKSVDENSKKTIVIAPSWQKDNIIDSCLEDILDDLKDYDYDITVRPHPQHVKHMPNKMEALKTKYAPNKNIVIQTDFSNTNTVLEADVLITDWSSVGAEYLFTTKKPALFIDTPMKVMNPEYDHIDTPPMNIWLRDIAGKIVPMDDVKNIHEYVKYLIDNKDNYKEKITELENEYIYNVGSAAKVSGEYIIDSLIEKSKKRNKE